MRLFEPTPAPTPTTKNISSLVEIPNGNGYSPFNIERSAVGWPTWVEDDSNVWNTLISKTVGWVPTSSGIPAVGGSGNFQYAVLADNSGNILAYLDYGEPQAFGPGQPIDVTQLLVRSVPNS